MNSVVGKTGILALSTGTFVYLYNNRHSHGRVLALQKDDSQVLTTEYCPPSERIEGRAKVPEPSAKDGPLVLQLQQVQVMFRHGARTPIHTVPRLPEVEYNAEFLTRDHQASMFPYERVSCVNGSHVPWSGYQGMLSGRPLRGGALPGSLTGYGKEQMYMLGLRLRDCYRLRLDITTFDANEVCILSSNVKRTVESAQSVLAGLYGKEQLIDYGETCGPVQIRISDPCYNILIPNTQDCDVLKKNNHSAMVHPDFLPGFKDQRLEVEAHIMKPREKLLEAVTNAQAKIDSMLQFYESEAVRTRRLELNKHRQHYQHDPMMHPLYEERSRAIANVDRFWANVLNRDPALIDVITKDDMKALIYLRNMEVEEFEGTLASGYRIHFYFDKNNPYFYNTHLCKEIFTQVNPQAPPSRETSIRWRPGRKLLPEEEEETEDRNEEEDQDNQGKGGCPPAEEKPKPTKPKIKQCQPCNRDPPPPPPAPEPVIPVPKSFFHWFTQPSTHGSDIVGATITGDVWKNPESLFENEPKVRDPWDQKLNFVFGRDDTVARVTHGLPYPPEVRRYRSLMETNATSILYYSLAGQTEPVRCVVTRLSAGPLLTEMIDQARKVVCGQKAAKLLLYSSHDSTMCGLMEALCIWDNKWPPFGSDVRLELYKEVGGCDFYVRVLYNGKEQRIRGQTESYMHWADFCNAVKKYTVRREDFDRICRSNILERIAQEVLKHEKGEVETQESKEETETPAGM